MHEYNPKTFFFSSTTVATPPGKLARYVAGVGAFRGGRLYGLNWTSRVRVPPAGCRLLVLHRGLGKGQSIGPFAGRNKARKKQKNNTSAI